MKGARYWTGRSMEWALEAGDRLMMSWVLFRRGEHAAADGDAAAVAGLAAAARREGKNLPGPMLAAILQQEAHAYALDGDEAACQAALDQAHGQAASPDDRGDASNGHGSFCTPAYVEMQRGLCWLLLGQPAKARAALDGAIRSLPPVYRRDRGVALSALATAFAAIGEADEAAITATQALAVARDAGSERIVSMVIPVATALAPYRSIDAVAQLREALGGTRPVLMVSAAEVAAMRRAIALSAAGLGTTSPNPPVGWRAAQFPGPDRRRGIPRAQRRSACRSSGSRRGRSTRGRRDCSRHSGALQPPGPHAAMSAEPRRRRNQARGHRRHRPHLTRRRRCRGTLPSWRRRGNRGTGLTRHGPFSGTGSPAFRTAAPSSPGPT